MRKRKRLRHCRVFRQQQFEIQQFEKEKKEVFTNCWDDLDTLAANISLILPQKNCGMCGYEDCYDLAKAIARGEERPDACRVAGKEIESIIKNLLNLEKMCSEVSGFFSKSPSSRRAEWS